MDGRVAVGISQLGDAGAAAGEAASRAVMQLEGRPVDLAVVFLTARDAPAEIVGALGFGDDYITKPFNIDEVVARITAVLRRTRENEAFNEWLGHEFDNWLQREASKELRERTLGKQTAAQ